MPVLRRLLPPILALLGSTAVAAQGPPATIQTGDEALAQDAGEYARANALPLDAAVARLRAQEASVPITDALAARFRTRLAGIAIEHAPAFRIVVLLTGDAAVADEVVDAAGLAVPVVFRTGALATRGEIVAAITQHQAAIRASLAHPPAMGVDLRTGTLVVVVANEDLAREGAAPLAQRLADLTGVPVRLSTVERPQVDLADPDPAPPAIATAPAPAIPTTAAPTIDGGARLVGVSPLDGRRYLCTAGFVVTDGARPVPRTGIATAAHCLDQISLVAPDGSERPLGFAGQWGWGFQDVQVNVSAEPLQPLFFANTARTLARPVTHARAVASTRAGDWVCHRGERTGYSCSAVELVDFAPAGDLCGGACLPQWITVGGPSCKGGDSGAPVFIGTAAVGIVKGGSYRPDGACAFYFYMATDYLPKGWSLLRQSPPTVQPLPSREGPAEPRSPIPANSGVSSG